MRVLHLLKNYEAESEDIEAVLREWALEVDHISAANFLQSEGLIAAPVMPNWEIVSDNHLNERGFFRMIRPPVAGTHLFPGFPWRFEKTPAKIYRPAPLFAEHNNEIFSALGLTPSAIKELIAKGITAEDPVYGDGPSL